MLKSGSSASLSEPPSKSYFDLHLRPLQRRANAADPGGRRTDFTTTEEENISVKMTRLALMSQLPQTSPRTARSQATVTNRAPPSIMAGTPGRRG